MCLTVTHVPASILDGFIVPVWKTLNTHDDYSWMPEGMYRTPCQDVWVKASEPIKASNPLRRSYLGQKIGPGGVHAYLHKGGIGHQCKAWGVGAEAFDISYSRGRSACFQAMFVCTPKSDWRHIGGVYRTRHEWSQWRDSKRLKERLGFLYPYWVEYKRWFRDVIGVNREPVVIL